MLPSEPQGAAARRSATDTRRRCSKSLTPCVAVPLQAFIAEWLATFMFLFCTIGCVVFTQDGGITTARQLEVSLVFGVLICILVFINAGISGGNINPAVSWGLMVAKRISPARMIAYTVAQCLGAICGAGFVRIMTPALFDKVDGGANEISANANAQEALGVEFGCTFLLVITVMAATDGVRAEANKHIGTIAPIVVGLAVTAAHFIAIPVDNCSINPARSFGVSAISGNWNDHWVVGNMIVHSPASRTARRCSRPLVLCSPR